MIDQSLLVAYSAITVYGNVYLYSFLKKQTKNNIALKVSIKGMATNCIFISFYKEIDKKKDRKRNVVPAQCGIMNAGGLVFTFLVYGCLYSIPNNNSWAAMDTMTRQAVGQEGLGHD